MALKLYSKLTHGLRYWLLKKLPTCQSMTQVMSESMERSLTVKERVLLKVHLWICIWCVWYMEHLHLMRDAIRLRAEKMNDDDATASLSLSADARERMKRALNQQKP